MHIHAHHPSCRLDKAKIDNMLQAEGNSSSPHQQHAGELRMMRDKNMKAEIEALYTDPESAACRLGPAAAVGGGGRKREAKAQNPHVRQRDPGTDA